MADPVMGERSEVIVNSAVLKQDEAVVGILRHAKFGDVPERVALILTLASL